MDAFAHHPFQVKEKKYIRPQSFAEFPHFITRQKLWGGSTKQFAIKKDHAFFKKRGLLYTIVCTKLFFSFFNFFHAATFTFHKSPFSCPNTSKGKSCSKHRNCGDSHLQRSCAMCSQKRNEHYKSK